VSRHESAKDENADGHAAGKIMGCGP
jgi:hypothetical protein